MARKGRQILAREAGERARADEDKARVVTEAKLGQMCRQLLEMELPDIVGETLFSVRRVRVTEDLEKFASLVAEGNREGALSEEIVGDLYHWATCCRDRYEPGSQTQFSRDEDGNVQTWSRRIGDRVIYQVTFVAERLINIARYSSLAECSAAEKDLCELEQMLAEMRRAGA